MPLQETSGNLTTDAFGGGVAAVPNYIEDVFSTWLYTGNSSTQSIVNNIDLSTKGGLVWIKDRVNAYSHVLFDTLRGAGKYISTNGTNPEITDSTTLTSFNANGFSLDSQYRVNLSGDTYASWTFRKQPKFFDVVTWSGNSFAGARAIPHNLGVAPAVIIVKNLTNSTNWLYMQGSSYLRLNTTSASDINNLNGGYADLGAATSTSFDVYPYFGTSQVNETGSNYVAYLFASNAGGFGLTGTDNVISCGSWTGDGTFNGSKSINLGWEPQFLLYKNASASTDWVIEDNMRGMPVSGADGKLLYPNLSGAEVATTTQAPNATGFSLYADNSSGNTYIYIAIRRGPMKVPTVGTSVYNATTGAAYSNPETVSVGFAPDLAVINKRTGTTGHYFVDRLRGGKKYFTSTSTAAEADDGDYKVTFDAQNSATVGGIFGGPYSGIFWFMRRAPSFFDEVCYTGTGSSPNVQTHNLGVAPELIIFKRRATVAANWLVATQFTASTFLFLYLDLDISNTTSSYPSGVLNSQPTSTSFSIANTGNVLNASGGTYVAYLFATCAGVSKVGSYTGNGTTQTIDCGFTGGARFVLIKRTDDVGDWYVYDTARGMTVLTDPYLLLNSTAAETATLGSVTTVSTGFALNSTILAAINVSSATYIFLAIA